LVEERVFAVVGGPDGEVEAPGDAALGGFPEEAGVGVFGEFVEADVTGVDSHGTRAGGEGDDAGAVVEFDEADFDFVGEAGGMAGGIEARDFQEFFAMREDGTGEIEEAREAVAEFHVFEGRGIIFGGEEVIAFLEAEAFADVFEGVGIGPADADGFFGESESGSALGVERALGFNPIELVRHEVAGEERGGVDGERGEKHKKSRVRGSVGGGK